VAIKLKPGAVGIRWRRRFDRSDRFADRSEINVLEHVLELRVNIHPLTHARVGKEMRATKPPHLALRFQALEFIVIRVPDTEQAQKI
jgi:hypothetical protein